MSSYLRCSGCSLTFSSERAFCAHRVGLYARGQHKSQRRCLVSVDELQRAGLVENPTKSRHERVVWCTAVGIQSWTARGGRFSPTPDSKYGHSDALVAIPAGAGGDSHAA